MALSIYVGVCTYLKGASRYHYFWYVSGFVTVVICLEAGPDPVRAFQTAMLRAQETGLGILVYTLVSILLWPRSSVSDFKAISIDLVSVHRRLCHAHLYLMDRQMSWKELQAIREQEVHKQSIFDQLLPTVESESYEVWAFRRHWGRFRDLSVELMETMEHLSAGLKEAREFDWNRFMPNLDVFSKELDKRFEQIEQTLAGGPPQTSPKHIDISIDKQAVKTLSPFQKAGTAVTWKPAAKTQ